MGNVMDLDKSVFMILICLCVAAIQSVMSSGDALSPGKTGGVGSAVFHLHDNGTLEYQARRRPGLFFYLWPPQRQNTDFLAVCPRSRWQVSPATSWASPSS